MRIVFRVDASLKMGTGHVMRCLTIANEFKLQSHEIFLFVGTHWDSSGYLDHKNPTKRNPSCAVASISDAEFVFSVVLKSLDFCFSFLLYRHIFRH